VIDTAPSIIRKMSAQPPQLDPLPPAADAAVAIVRDLRAARHEALFAGGSVRDLLLGRSPKDYDIATDAPPDRIRKLFRPTRLVGQAFGVVLVRRMDRWVEVATFRSDGTYSDGRRPDSVTFASAREDAQRRDFTINGMFLDPVELRVIDYVGGQADLTARVVRCIGDPATRFSEDYLRLLRAVRIASRLGFAIEPATLVAMEANAPAVAKVAPERVREELEKMLAGPGRAAALAILLDTGLLRAVLDMIAPRWSELLLVDARTDAGEWVRRLPESTPFEATFACLMRGLGNTDVHDVCRRLTCSNEQRELVAWLVQHHRDLEPLENVSLAAFKRLMSNPAFAWLCEIAVARSGSAEGLRRAIMARKGAIDPARVQPAPLVTGDDLIARGMPAGPMYSRVLDELYRRQLEEELTTREQALAALELLLRSL
jgi:poly(A) polymerase